MEAENSVVPRAQAAYFAVEFQSARVCVLPRSVCSEPELVCSGGSSFGGLHLLSYISNAAETITCSFKYSETSICVIVLQLSFNSSGLKKSLI